MSLLKTIFQTNGYVSCVQAYSRSRNRYGISVWAEDITSTQATITVVWRPTNDRPASTSNLAITGGTISPSVAQIRKKIWRNGGALSAIATRNPNSDFRFVIGIGRAEGTVFIPAAPEPIIEKSVVIDIPLNYRNPSNDPKGGKGYDIPSGGEARVISFGPYGSSVTRVVEISTPPASEHFPVHEAIITGDNYVNYKIQAKNDQNYAVEFSVKLKIYYLQ